MDGMEIGDDVADLVLDDARDSSTNPDSDLLSLISEGVSLSSGSGLDGGAVWEE